MLNCIVLNSTQKQMVEVHAILETCVGFQTFLHCSFLLQKKQTAQVRLTQKNTAVQQKCSHAEIESKTGSQMYVMLNIKEIH